jgi:hypothetical protein
MRKLIIDDETPTNAHCRISRAIKEIGVMLADHGIAASAPLAGPQRQVARAGQDHHKQAGMASASRQS